MVERVHGKDEVSGSIPDDGSRKYKQMQLLAKILHLVYNCSDI